MIARAFSLVGLSGLALAVCACAGASREGRPPTFDEELRQLRAECAERGGILTPIPGSYTGRPRSDNACEIRGGASRVRD